MGKPFCRPLCRSCACRWVDKALITVVVLRHTNGEVPFGDSSSRLNPLTRQQHKACALAL